MSALVMDAIFSATLLVFPVAEKYTTRVASPEPLSFVSGASVCSSAVFSAPLSVSAAYSELLPEQAASPMIRQSVSSIVSIFFMIFSLFLRFFVSTVSLFLQFYSLFQIVIIFVRYGFEPLVTRILSLYLDSEM